MAFGTLLPILLLSGYAGMRALAASKSTGPKTIPVVRGELVDKALAVGTIEPRIEVMVKSILPGVVRQQFAEVGSYVRKGQPLLEIAPNSTPLELIELRRSIEMRQIE